MNRVFHKRITPTAVLYAVLLAALSLFFFWQATAVSALVGLIPTALTVIQVEQSLHTTYTLTGDGRLQVYRGRFFRNLSVHINEIIRLQKQKALFGIFSFVLVEYGARHLLVVIPDNMQGFIDELQKRRLHV